MKKQQSHQAGLAVIHKNLGTCFITLECAQLQSYNPDPSSIMVLHDGEIKEVSRNMIDTLPPNFMAKSTQQKAAANLWRMGLWEEEEAADNRVKARYLSRSLRDIGSTKNVEADAKLDMIRKLADEVKELLSEDDD